ncbi:MAG: hypothetical protein KQH59_09205 [Desulfobulbaceae bacterium]|nr:hypothetical protein [Desulfobulbaceae bacterium]
MAANQTILDLSHKAVCCSAKLRIAEDIVEENMPDLDRQGGVIAILGDSIKAFDEIAIYLQKAK